MKQGELKGIYPFRRGLCLATYGRLVERLTRLPFKEEIAGSNPVPVTKIAGSLFGDYGR